MKIATWNVNSIKARIDRLRAFLERHAPDVACLQELKLEETAFPYQELGEQGYRAVVLGQKSYNGVAILARTELADVARGLGSGHDDPSARAIAATASGLRVLNVYVPNGGTTASDKYAYKLAWLDRLIEHVRTLLAAGTPLLLCGDFNVAPEDRDVARPEEWAESVLCAPEVRMRFHELLALGLVDCVRKHHPEGGPYTWWDYRMLGFQKGNGLRIDHVLATAEVAERCRAAYVDRNERKGKLPSDHAPVLIELA